jgi:hypothetical protein
MKKKKQSDEMKLKICRVEEIEKGKEGYFLIPLPDSVQKLLEKDNLKNIIMSFNDNFFFNDFADDCRHLTKTRKKLFFYDYNCLIENENCKRKTCPIYKAIQKLIKEVEKS